MYENSNFLRENKGFCITFVIVVLIGVVAVWLLLDHERNGPIYENTDRTVEQLEKRVGDLESRLDSVSARLEKAQQTVSGISATVTAGRENAVTVADGISGVEKRLDECIQRSGRIANLITDIENANRQRAAGP